MQNPENNYLLKPALYAFDNDQTHDLLWGEIPNAIALDLYETFRDRFLCADGKLWVSLIDRYCPMLPYPWASRWSQNTYEFIRQLSKAKALFDGEISGYAYGLSPYPAITFDLQANIPQNFSFTLKKDSEVAITWLQRSTTLFGDRIHPEYSEYCAVYSRRCQVFKSGKEKRKFTLDSRQWLLNSVVISDESKVEELAESEPIDFFLYKNQAATWAWMFTSWAFPTPQYLAAWDVAIEATTRSLPFGQREVIIGQTYESIVCTSPTYANIPDWWFFASLLVANNNPWGEGDNLEDLGKEINLYYNEITKVLFFALWQREPDEPTDKAQTMPISLTLANSLAPPQGIALNFGLFTNYPGVPSPNSIFLESNLDLSFEETSGYVLTSIYTPPNILGDPADKRTKITHYTASRESILIFSSLIGYVPFLNPDVRLFKRTEGAIFFKAYLDELAMDVTYENPNFPNYSGSKTITLQTAKGTTSQTLSINQNQLSWVGSASLLSGNVVQEWISTIYRPTFLNGEIISGSGNDQERFIGWEHEAYSLTYPSVRVSREIWATPIPAATAPDPELVETTIDNLLENDLDPDTEGLIMADSVRVKEIHAALEAQKFGVDPDKPDELRVANLGYYIERIGRVLGISVNPDGGIRSIRQAKPLKAGEDLPAGWSIAQWGRNQGGSTSGQKGGESEHDKDGMAYEVISNTFQKNVFTGQASAIAGGGNILVENWPQYFEMFKDDLDKILAGQESAANILPDPDNPKKAIEYEGLGSLVAEIAYMLSEYGKHLNAIRVLGMGNQAMIQELIAAHGVPVTVKEIKTKIGTENVKIPYPALDITAPTQFDQTVWIMAQLGQLYAGNLAPRYDLIQKALEAAIQPEED